MMKKICIYSMLILILSALSAVVAAAETYADLRADYFELSSSTQLQRQRGNWERLLERFDRFVAQHPLDPQLEKILFLQARTWDGLSKASGRQTDAQQAIDRYLAMAEHFPHSHLADDALFHAGQAAEYRLQDRVTARLYYQRLVTGMPDGDMVAEAAKRLSVLPEPVVVSRPVAAQTNQQDYHSLGDSPRLEKVRFWSGPQYTRVVFDLSAPVVAKPHYLKGENPRLYFDLLYTKPVSDLNNVVKIRNGLVKQVRSSLFDEQRTRVVIDLNRVVEYKLVTLDNPHRLVVDLIGTPSETALSSRTTVSDQTFSAQDDSIASILDSSADRQPTLHVPQEKQRDGVKLIVVDAGHGGKDPGAIGPNNIMEKDVTLKLAKALAASLRQKMGVKVLLTRSDDRYLELRERTDYANRVGADLFISLHANASPQGKAYGVETYFLNLSKNNQAAEVAARENGTTLQEVGHLEAILFDLMANAKINESSRLAAEVQQAMVSGLRPHFNRIKDLGVKQGPFHVLLGATMPSVLVEAAFISHPREEKRLVSSDYQNQVAAAIVNGVMNYTEAIDQVAKR
ncbi:MAG: N-acetylmuramoyl-L-alanine amidase [Desulfuromonadales bacterium]|nr:N-acetylmuramoyl-L-alanine amidase [Desulfuromonadales bacterium]MBN2792393.1 N-acetylmuramoyl-L-alanine amidase [Desulfuromonadales bacterium]